MRDQLGRIWREEQGQDLIEYVLLAVLVSLGAVSSVHSLAKAISDTFSNAAVNMSQAAS